MSSLRCLQTLAILLDERSVDDENGCLTWLGSRIGDGYGSVWVGTGSMLVHRLAFYLSGETIPEGKVLDHLCKNRACINVDHLEVVSLEENTRRGSSYWSKQTHCIHGHEFNEKNTYLSKVGKRQCRTCQRLRVKKKRAERKLNGNFG